MDNNGRPTPACPPRGRAPFASGPRPRLLDVTALQCLMPKGAWDPPGTSGRQEVGVWGRVLPLGSHVPQLCSSSQLCTSLPAHDANVPEHSKQRDSEDGLRGRAGGVRTACPPHGARTSSQARQGVCRRSVSFKVYEGNCGPTGSGVPNHLTYLGPNRTCGGDTHSGWLTVSHCLDP